MMKLAEEKKERVRVTINQMRSKFKDLILKNSELPSHLQLDRKVSCQLSGVLEMKGMKFMKILKQEFEMDPEIKKELERHTREKIELVRKEMGWEEEKHRVALEKLRSRSVMK